MFWFAPPAPPAPRPAVGMAAEKAPAAMGMGSGMHTATGTTVGTPESGSVLGMDIGEGKEKHDVRVDVTGVEAV